MLEITGLTTCLGVGWCSIKVLILRENSNSGSGSGSGFGSGFCFASVAECPPCEPSSPLSPAPRG